MANTTSERVLAKIIKSNPASPLKGPAVDKIVSMINRWENEGKRPLSVFCINTGKESAMTAIALFESRMAKNDNDVTKLLTTYVGRDGKVKVVKPIKAAKKVATKVAKKAAKKVTELVAKTASDVEVETPKTFKSKAFTIWTRPSKPAMPALRWQPNGHAE